MIDTVPPNTPVAVPVGKTVFLALLTGLSIQLVGTLTWVALIRLNAREYAEWPWAAMTMGCVLAIMMTWLGGRGWPRGSSRSRQFHLRLWRPEPGAWSGENRTTILGLIAALTGLSVLYAVIGSTRPPVDVGPYSLAFRWSFLIMGPIVAGVVEEAAFRGYMQSHLERIGPTFAIVVTSTVFTLLHATQGLTYMLMFGPGIFIASSIYGYLAQRSGSILPGMVLHVVGDVGYAYFASFGGDWSVLFEV